MSAMKFRVVEEGEQKSIQELQEQFDNELQPVVEDVIQQEEVITDEVVSNDIDDARVLSYLKDRYQKEYLTMDEAFSQKSEIPEDVKKLMEFGVDNYVKINKDWSEANSSDLLKEYYKQTKPHLDDEDIDYLLEDEYSYDEDIDDDRDIKRKKVALKEELFRAKEYLNDLKEQYKVDLGAKSADVSDDYKNAFSFYQEYTQNSKQELEIAQAKADVFNEKTNKLFSNDFKGFEFDLGDKKQVFKPSNIEETKNAQLDITNVIKSHLDGNGYLKDEHKYHKSLAMFRDPDGYAKFFYEQGKSDATNNVIKSVKNIDMSVRDNKEVTDNGSGPRMRVIKDSSFDSGLKIRKNN
jgi:hypothetical protein